MHLLVDGAVDIFFYPLCSTAIAASPRRVAFGILNRFLK